MPSIGNSHVEELLQIEIPAVPQSLVEVSVAIAAEEPDVRQLSKYISRDMSLSSTILRTLNSPMFALAKPVTNVQDAITYLGFREVASQVFAQSLRSVFAPSRHLELIMSRATLRSMIMGRLAQILDMHDPWAAHAAGIFSECGKAVLLKARGAEYERMLEEHGGDDVGLRIAEIQAFGIGHDDLSAQLCAKWGVASAAVQAIRTRLDAIATQELPSSSIQRDLAFLQIVAEAIIASPETAAQLAAGYAARIDRSEQLVNRMVSKIVDYVTDV